MPTDDDLPGSVSGLAVLLVDSVPDGVVVVDATGVICHVNRRMDLMFGYTTGEVLGQDVDLLVPEWMTTDHQDVRGPDGDATVKSPSASRQVVARRKDGTRFPVDISRVTVETGDGPLVVATVREIPPHEVVAETFAGVFDAAPDAIVAVDAAGLIRLVNRQSEALFGYPRRADRPADRGPCPGAGAVSSCRSSGVLSRRSDSPGDGPGSRSGGET